MNYGEFTALFADARNELAYVTDIETYEMVFMTKAAMEMVGISSKEEYRGQKCYRILQGLDEPCPFCTNRYLLEGQSPYVWQQYNPVMKKWLRLENYLFELNGRRLRGEWATDISGEHDAISSLQDQLVLEKVLMKSIRTLALEPDAHTAVNLFLQYLGTYYQADRAVIFETDHSRGIIRNTYEWCAPGIPSQMADYQNDPLDRITDWLDSFQDDVPQQATPESEQGTVLGGVLANREVNDLLIAPLRKDGMLVGFLGVDNARAFAADPTLLRLSANFITEEFQKRQLVRDLGSHEWTDRLTGLQNRHKYRQVLDQYQHTPPKSMAVLFLDLNGMKEVNDQGGHDAGDLFICRCAEILHRLELNAFRVDGDEFVILLPDADEETALRREKELRAALKDLQPNTASLGFAWSEQNVNVQALINEADDRMYAEKQIYYREVLSRDCEHRTGIATDVLQDIRSGRFVVYFQPQVELRTGAIYGGEALVRKLDEDGQIIPPDRFIPFYEAEGVISHIDFHVLEQACAQMKAWREELGQTPHVSVNFSRQTLLEFDVIPRITAVCAKYGVPPQQITIEVTESANKLSREQLHSLVQGLQEAGFSVSLDDFGSRYSNLSILTSIDFQLIKLDKSLISNIDSEEKSAKIVENLVHLFKDTISTPSLAEGVETAEQVAILQDFSCDYVQGYYFSRPIPAANFTEMLRANTTFSV